MSYGQMALAAYNIIGGMVNTSKANAEANYLERTKPVKKTSQFDRDALAQSESDLANPLSAETEQAYEDNQDRSLSSSISAILKGGGSVNNIADMYGNTAQGRQQLAIVRDNIRMKKVDEYLKQLDKMAQEEEKNWLTNEYGPYINKIKAVAEAKKAAAEQTAKGLDSYASGLGGIGSMLGGIGGGGGGSTGGGNAIGGLGGSGSGGTGGNPSGGTGNSDKRMKHNYYVVGKSPSGINIYEFSYLGSNDRYRGVMAQEVGYAAFMGEDGMMWVDYSLIDVEFKKL